MATMMLDEGGDHSPIGGEGADSGFFIVAHETAVARDISAEDGGEFAFHANHRCVFSHPRNPCAGNYSAVAVPLSIITARDSNISLDRAEQQRVGRGYRR